MAQKVFIPGFVRYTHVLMNNTASMLDVGSANPSGFSELASPPTTLADALDRLEIEKTRRQQAEEALLETETRFRQFSERAGKFLWISDPESNELIYVSPGFEEVWSRNREKAYATPDEWLNTFNQATAETGTRLPRSHNDQIYQVAAPDGTVRWVRDRMFPVCDASGHVNRVLGIAEDVTDTKAMHDTLEKTLARDKALLDILPDLILRVRKDGVVLEYHAGDSHNFISTDALNGQNLARVLPASLSGEMITQLRATLETGQQRTFDFQHVVDEELREFEARATVCASNEVLVLVRDVTERKRLEREIIEAGSREQQRIGQDLHDSLGQHLTGITFLTKVLERKLTAQSRPEANEAAEIGKLVMQALAQTRNLARGLFPAELESNGLVAALTELSGSVTRTCGLRCQLNAKEDISIGDNVLATHIFRIAQEAINNSVKHSKAKHIDVLLRRDGDRFELSVTDDGNGIPAGAKLDGLGLRIMDYRARRIGGTLEISRTEKGGTRITCYFRNKYESN